MSGGTSLSCKLSIILSVQDEGFVERLLVEELDKLGTLRSKSNIHGDSTNLLVPRSPWEIKATRISKMYFEEGFVVVAQTLRC